jgi:phosphoglucomutase
MILSRQFGHLRGGDSVATHTLARQLAPAGLLIDVTELQQAYHERRPNPGDPRQRVAFGTSGHRGTPLANTFTESHILAISQAICDFRVKQAITGPLFLGKDTHALSGPAQRTTLEVLAANDAPIGGLQVISRSGWFAARPSGTEDIYRLYAESFRGQAHLDSIVEQVQQVIHATLAGVVP